jgi:hypothetical protein
MEHILSWLGGLGTIAWVMLMIIAIAVCNTIVAVVRMNIKHKERMAMIERGINPGPPQEAYNQKVDEV